MADTLINILKLTDGIILSSVKSNNTYNSDYKNGTMNISIDDIKGSKLTATQFMDIVSYDIINKKYTIPEDRNYIYETKGLYNYNTLPKILKSIMSKHGTITTDNFIKAMDKLSGVKMPYGSDLPEFLIETFRPSKVLVIGGDYGQWYRHSNNKNIKSLITVNDHILHTYKSKPNDVLYYKSADYEYLSNADIRDVDLVYCENTKYLKKAIAVGKTVVVPGSKPNKKKITYNKHNFSIMT